MVILLSPLVLYRVSKGQGTQTGDDLSPTLFLPKGSTVRVVEQVRKELVPCQEILPTMVPTLGSWRP